MVFHIIPLQKLLLTWEGIESVTRSGNYSNVLAKLKEARWEQNVSNLSIIEVKLCGKGVIKGTV